MLSYPHIDPIALTLGPIQVHWYGIMYLVGFAAAWLLGLYRCRQPCSPVNRAQIGDIVFYAAIGVVLGGRIGYILFYDFFNFIHYPWLVFKIWEGGMSFHGGLLGVIVAEGIYCKIHRLSFVAVMDFFVPMVPVGLGAGRFGNFINGELWGRVTDSPLGMIFPTGGPLPRYPSQLIELALEGVVMFIILWTLSIKPKPRGFMIALFLICYGSFRFIAEFFRQPDPQIGFIFGWMTEGQLLSLPMALIGGGMLIWVFKNAKRRCLECVDNSGVTC